MQKKAIIIGAGPAGLTAAWELLKRTDVIPTILEKSGDIGGISKTINYKGNRMDIGGHRFFSKSDRVMNWWMNIMPIQASNDTNITITYQRKHRVIRQEETQIPTNVDDNKTMLVRKRLSRIYFLRKFFTYPIQLSIETLSKLGPVRTLGILVSYLKARLLQRKPEKNLEDFLINRFGKKLYLLFFKHYTEKVWGVSTDQISAEWGAQRIKGVSISKAIQHALQSIIRKKKVRDIAQRDTETSLIEQFLYPALGPGQLWEEVARQVVEMGGEILHYQDVTKINPVGKQISSITAINTLTGKAFEYKGHFFFSTMPIQELIAGMTGEVPDDVEKIAAGLQYRDFITVGVLLDKFTHSDNKNSSKILADTWIYIQEKDVKVGRLQIFNNWSPFMVKDPNTVWIGMEYFCNKEDDFWNLADADIERIAITELEKMGLANVENVLDSTIYRMEKTYPAYFGTYNQFDTIRNFTDQFENLFLIGRNGMHKYNNSDHSMLTAMVSVDNICEGSTRKENIWEINNEQEYHEEKVSTKQINKMTVHKTDNECTSQLVTDSLQQSFRNFIFKPLVNKKYLFIAFAAVALQLVIFKSFYPFADFSNDSFTYILSALNNDSISMRPIGYSRFLALFRFFSDSDTAVVCFQYILLELSALCFFFTIQYFLSPTKKTSRILFSFLIFNPISLYLANYIGPDALFAALSLLWLTHLIWIINKPSTEDIIVHTLLLLILFTIRYNALFYPVITSVTLLVSQQKRVMKLLSIISLFLITFLFISYTTHKTYKEKGIRQFSSFSSWQLANNALHVFNHILVDTNKIPQRFKQITNISGEFFLNKGYNQNQMPLLVTSDYMWDDNGPLKNYWRTYMKENKLKDSMIAWYQVAPYLRSYGNYLIQTHPQEFVRYYILPNIKNFLLPPLEILKQYNLGKDTVMKIAQYWFGFNSNSVNATSKTIQFELLLPFVSFYGILNVTFLITILIRWIINIKSGNNCIHRNLIPIKIFLLANFCFSIISAPNVLRYQFFPMLSCFVFCLITINTLSQFDWRTYINKYFKLKY